MRTIKFTYKDNGTETFEDVTAFYHVGDKFIIETKSGNYTVNYNDIKGYIDSNND